MANHGTIKSGVYTDPANRQKDDFYATDPDAVLELLKAEKFNGGIWEPACGEGDISKTLIATGYYVVSTDLVNRGYGDYGVDFLFCHEMLGKTKNIVTNPPFRLSLPFIENSCQLVRRHGGKVAMFLPLSYLAGKERKKWYENHMCQLSRVWIFSYRAATYKNGIGQPQKANNMTNYAWFVFDYSAPKHPPVIGWV